MSFRLFIVTQDTLSETAAITSCVIDFGAPGAAESAFVKLTKNDGKVLGPRGDIIYRNYVTKLYDYPL